MPHGTVQQRTTVQNPKDIQDDKARQVYDEILTELKKITGILILMANEMDIDITEKDLIEEDDK